MTPSEKHHSHDGYNHKHDYAASSDTRLKWALALTAGFMGLEVIAGFWSGSLALIADAGHMLTDSASLGLALYAARASRRPADAARSYGYGRARVLAAFTNGLSLLLIAAWIVIEAAQRLFKPVEVLAGPMLIVAVLGLGINVIAYLILRGGSDINTQGALAHVLGDLLGSVAAIAAAGIILATGWMPADPLLSIVVAALIARTGTRITHQSAHTLLEGTPAGFDAKRVEASLLQAVPQLQGVHDLHAWNIGTDETYISLHARVARDCSPDAVIRAVETHLSERFRIRHVTTQVEYEDCPEHSH